MHKLNTSSILLPMFVLFKYGSFSKENAILSIVRKIKSLYNLLLTKTLSFTNIKLQISDKILLTSLVVNYTTLNKPVPH